MTHQRSGGLLHGLVHVDHAFAIHLEHVGNALGIDLISLTAFSRYLLEKEILIL